MSSFTFRWSANRLLLLGVALEAALLAAFTYSHAAHALIGTAAFAARTWLFLLPFPVLLLAMEEGRKAVVRRRMRGPASAP